MLDERAPECRCRPTAMALVKIEREKRRYRTYLAVVDTAMGAGALLLALLLVHGMQYLFEAPTVDCLLYSLLVPGWLLSLYLQGQYEFHPRWLGTAGAYRNVRAVVVGTLACIAITYFVTRGIGLSRAVFAYSTLFASVLFSLDRALAIRLFPQRVLRERYLLLGLPARGSELARALTEGELPAHVEIVGYLADGGEPGSGDGGVEGAPVLGGLQDVEAVLPEHEVSHVAVCPDAPKTAALAHAASHSEAMGVSVQRLETVYENLTGRAPVLLAGTDWGEGLSSIRHHPYLTPYKRVVDVVMALLLLPIGLVAMGIAALAIKLSSPGPVLYSQKRVGKDGKEFTFTKLRTMVVDAERDTGAVWATEDDPRITRVGRVLRKLRIDELPQLFSVLKGDMSLVGPRPERPEFVSDFVSEIPFYEKRLLVRPGITGWAQVNHRYDQSIEDVVEKLRYDLYYVRHLSFTLDLQIMLRTLWVMLGRKGAM